MSSRPFLPLFVGDYLADTRELSRSEHGGYLLLLMEYWTKGQPLPDDDRILRAITLSSKYAWQKLRKKLQNFFTLEGGYWHHKRVDRDLAKLKHRNDLAARNETPQSRAYIARAAQSHNHITKDSAPTERAPAPRARPPTEPARPPAGMSIFERGKEILGIRGLGLLGKMLNLHGHKRVEHALDEVGRINPESPSAFFRSCCEGKHAQAARAPPGPLEYTAEEMEAARHAMHARFAREDEDARVKAEAAAALPQAA